MQSNLSLTEKESEVSNLINLLQLPTLSMQTLVILKSTVLLMLYNAIDSSMTELLTLVHEEIAYSKFSDLKIGIQNLMLEYLWTQKPNEDVRGAFMDIVSFPFFDDYTKKINLFSGNLDARKINTILRKYGIDCLKSAKQEKLVIVKTKRNQLAHGELSFKVACRDMTIEDIIELKDAVYECLNELYINVQKFLNNKDYIER